MSDTTETAPEDSGAQVEPVQTAEPTQTPEPAPPIQSDAPKESVAPPPMARPESRPPYRDRRDEGPRPPGQDRPGGGPRRDGDQSRGGYRSRPRTFYRRKVCKFCKGKSTIDYKDVGALRRFTTDRGKILPRRITGTCAKHQRRLANAIKRARILAMLPFAQK